MSDIVDQLPPPPRRLVPFTGFEEGWPFGALGLVCGFLFLATAWVVSAIGGVGIVTADMTDGARVAEVRGRVLDATTTFIHRPNGNLRQIRYQFEVGERTLEGTTTIQPGPPLRAGSDVMVRYAVDDPTRNRLARFAPAMVTPGMRLVLSLLLVGGLGTLVWIRRVMLRRNLLVHGLETSAAVLGSEPTRSARRTVRLRYVTHSGEAIENTLLESVPVSDAQTRRVLYDEHDPRSLCLADARHFARGRSALDAPTT